MSRAPVRLTSGAMPPRIAEQIRRIGPVIDPPATVAAYAPLHQKEPYSGVRVQRDLKYGPHPRHALDVFMPERTAAARPVLIFVHGGAYTAGHKREGSDYYYDNVMLWAARNAMVGVNITYRLAPEFSWPAGPEDVAAAVRWVRANITTYGGDPERIFLMGHSAGATHVGSYAVMPWLHGADGHGLRGVILVSGTFDLSIGEMNERYVAYFGTEQSKYTERSPIAGLLKTDIPLMIAYAELEPPPILEQTERLVAALAKAGREAQVIRLRHHGHISIIHAVNTEDTELSDAVRRFVTSVG